MRNRLGLAVLAGVLAAVCLATPARALEIGRRAPTAGRHLHVHPGLHRHLNQGDQRLRGQPGQVRSRGRPGGGRQRRSHRLARGIHQGQRHQASLALGFRRQALPVWVRIQANPLDLLDPEEVLKALKAAGV